MLAVLAMLARRGALRVTAGGSAPLFPFVARHGLCRARSGREGRRADRTGRRELGGRRVDDRVAFGVEGDGAGRCPVAGLPAPATRGALPGRLIECVARPEQIAILAGMALAGGDVADGAVAVLIIVPAHEPAGPFSGGVAIGKSAGGEVGP